MKIVISVFVAGLALLMATMMSIGAGENAVEIKGQSTDLGVDTFTWDNSTFPGFYYDSDQNIGAEKLTFSLSNVGTGKDTATLSDQPDTNNNRGVVYTTSAQLKTFKYKAWGQYDVIGFLGDRYFAAYDPTVTADVTNSGATVAYLYDTSKNRNLMTNEQITKILIDNNTEKLIDSNSPLKLEEGYELHLKSVNLKNTQVIVELMKNGQIIDTEMIRPLIAGATMADKTYCYKVDLGFNAIVQIAVHFKSVSHGASKDSAIVDGIFQISDTVAPLKSGQQYDKMSIRNVDATGMTITMDNKDNQITLSKNIDVPLMQNIHIKTADQSIIDAANPLKYYIYSEKHHTFDLGNAIVDTGTYIPASNVEIVKTNGNMSRMVWDWDTLKNVSAATQGKTMIEVYTSTLGFINPPVVFPANSTLAQKEDLVCAEGLTVTASAVVGANLTTKADWTNLMNNLSVVHTIIPYEGFATRVLSHGIPTAIYAGAVSESVYVFAVSTESDVRFVQLLKGLKVKAI